MAGVQPECKTTLSVKIGIPKHYMKFVSNFTEKELLYKK